MTRKKIAENVYIVTYGDTPETDFEGYKYLVHVCKPDHLDREAIMHLRKNEAGPLYWCPGCGFTIENGLAMAIRLNELEI